MMMMKRRRTLPRLHRKLLRLVFTATASALLLCAAGLMGYEVHTFRNAVENDLRAQADLLGQSLAATLSFNDTRAAREALAAWGLRADVAEAAVFDAAGQPFARFPTGAGPATVPAGESVSVSWLDGQVVYRIRHGDDLLGTLVLRSRHDLLRRSFSYLWIVALGIGAGLLVAWVAFRRLHPLVTAPLLELTQAAQQVVERRDYDVRVTVAGDDEVGLLTQAFNRMLDDLSSEMRERRDAEAALRQADRRKDEFLAVLAHELRNPLAPLVNAAALLRLKGDDPAVRDRAQQMMARQLDHMKHMIDDLLDVSRITRGAIELHRQALDLVPLVRSAVESMEPALQERHHRLTLDLPTAALPVHADPTRLTQVLMNLLANAAKFTPEGGRVDVAVGRDADHAYVVVRDTGRGISAEHAASIFEMFVQVDTSLERGAAGLGIGLTIAHQLVALHGGQLRVDSAGLGQGAAFTVALPLVDATA